MTDEINNNQTPDEAPKKVVEIPAVLKVSDFAEVLSQPVTEVMRYLLKNGVLVTINDNIDFDTAAIVADDFGFELKLKAEANQKDSLAEEISDTDEKDDLIERAPVVTIMGHVDHGKTSLLDYIRETKVASTESGGITQHMGSYQVDYKEKKITFIDTPGHEAFGSIRAQGTKVTDIVVLVVAADDGVKPQTIEAIELAKAAGVPIIAAATKIDRPEANLDKVKQELAGKGILTEKWGGKIPFVGVSAKTGEGVDELLELIALTAEVAELKAPKVGSVSGIILESEQDSKIGQVATVIIQKGTLKVGNIFVAGGAYGKIRSMQDHFGKRITEAFPAMPVRVVGFVGSPQVGDQLVTVKDEKTARQTAASRRVTIGSRGSNVKASDLGSLIDKIKSQQGEDLKVMLKADVQGSLQAILSQLEALKTNKGGQIKVINSGIGAISESDVLNSQGENAVVVGFKVPVLPGVQKIADKDDVKIITYDIIYKLTEDLGKLLTEIGDADRKEEIVADGEILKIFMSTAKKKIIGVKVGKGKTNVGDLMRIYRGDDKVGEGKITNIKLVAEEVSEASKGEFGFMVDLEVKAKAGDRIEFVKVEYIPVKLV
ncbi:MAG: translation initiation factor IF-2 [Patescibacteria group bacterium]|nr:translation initiation factor IF-2 [Patescibacteria group bacterium]